MSKFFLVVATSLVCLFSAARAEAAVEMTLTTVLNLHSGDSNSLGLNGATMTLHFTSSATHYTELTRTVWGDMPWDPTTTDYVPSFAWETFSVTIAGSTGGKDGTYALNPSQTLYAVPNYQGTAFFWGIYGTENLGIAGASFTFMKWDPYYGTNLPAGSPAAGDLIRSTDFATTGWAVSVIAQDLAYTSSNVYNALDGTGTMSFTAVPEPGAYGAAVAGLLGLAAVIRRRRAMRS